MQEPMRTLSVLDRVGESLVGTTSWGPRFEHVSLGRAIPGLRGREDAEAILRCGFLDSGTPLELNLIRADTFRLILRQRLLTDPTAEGWLDPESVLRDHPSVGYLPPELFCLPNAAGLSELARSGVAGELLARLWLERNDDSESEINWSAVGSKNITTDKRFWRAVAEAKVYPLLLGDLLTKGQNVRLSLLAPPVPVLREGFSEAPDLQLDINNVAATLMAPATGSTSTIHPAYSFWVHASALGEPDMLNHAINNLRVALAETGNGFRAVHLSFHDLSMVASSGVTAIRSAKQLAAKVASVASASGRFVIVSDTGPIGWTFLDRGAAFTTYSPNLVIRRTYPMRRAPASNSEKERKRANENRFGKVIGGPWNYVLLSLRDVRRQGWKLEPLEGKFRNEVSTSDRRDSTTYRVNFSKPYNVAVQETLNDAREAENIKKKNARPGSSTIGRSDDPNISHWWS